MSHVYVRLVLGTTLPRPEKLVSLAIAYHVDKYGEGCFASYRTLADETSYDERQVMRIVEGLEQAGIVVFQGKHPQYGTNIWNIDKSKLPLRPSRQRTPVQEPAGQVESCGDADEPEPENVILKGDILAPQEAQTAPPDPAEMSPNLSSEKERRERENKGPAAGAARPGRRPLPPVMDARWSPPRRGQARDDDGLTREPLDALPDDKARFRPDTDLQRKVAQLCQAGYLSLDMKSRLRNPVTAAWGDKRPTTYPDPESEWVKHPDWFNEYVELCAKRIREESGRPPGRSALIQTIRRYDRHKTGWLDFKAAKERERPAGRTAQWYTKPGVPSWMQ